MKWLLPVAFLLALASTASASRTATVTVSPTPPQAGDALVFTGCGYDAAVVLEVISPTSTDWETVSVTDGCFTSTRLYVAEQGGYTVRVSLADGHKHLAALNFQVI